MTVLAAMHDAERRVTWIGSDTYASMGGLKFRSAPKWVVGPWWAVGCAGDGRLQTLVEAHLSDELVEETSVTDLAERLRELVKDDGWNISPEPGAPDYGVWIVLASSEGVWSVCSAFSVDRMKGYWADGSGGQVAMGAMYVAQEKGLRPQEIVEIGVEAAIEHQHSCGGRAWVNGLEREVELAAVGD